MIGFIHGGFFARHERRPCLQILDAGIGQFQTHQAGNTAADDTRRDGENQVESTDILMVGGHEPARKKRRLVVRIMCVIVKIISSCSDSSHGVRPSYFVGASAAAAALSFVLGAAGAAAAVSAPGILPPFAATQAANFSGGKASTAIGI